MGVSPEKADRMTSRIRKRIKHFHEPGHLHEFTFSCYRRLKLLTNDDWRKRLSRAIDNANQKCHWELVAFVYMPEHVHLLVNPLDPNPDFGQYLQALKQPFSQQIHGTLKACESKLLERLVIRDRPDHECFRFWQEGAGYDRNLFSPKALLAAIDYIHENPVRRGLCQRAIDWKWSSARWYLLDPPRQQDPDLPFIHGLPAGTIIN